jgi:RIO-like serine/threonine protein kinase
MSDFKSIIVTPGKPVNILTNPSTHPLIGKGIQGAVFKISDDRCVKVYAKKTYCRREGNVFRKIGMESTIVPKVYEIGTNYIIMEYLTGPSLREHLDSTGAISEQISKQIIELIKELTRMSFSRIDFALRHCIFNKDGKLKIIDHVNSFKVKRSNPTRLLKDLKQLGLLPSFLEHVKNMEPTLYQKWRILL